MKSELKTASSRSSIIPINQFDFPPLFRGKTGEIKT